MADSLSRLAFAFTAAALLAACSQESGMESASATGSPSSLIDSCDADGDRMVDTEEYNDCFADSDRDRDGRISEDEAHGFGGHGGRR
jgi:hypothetical protein